MTCPVLHWHFARVTIYLFFSCFSRGCCTLVAFSLPAPLAIMEAWVQPAECSTKGSKAA
ncbi:hypothetical protein FA10DRAFT_69729 [Acaromyces ingoldii]|uniref:Uncharacterized protein n=1 Tax=Acaromyces ingoldii TaxID=215250 RepID=A0A316YQ97_9BASI|nr:hypothetical protein FA10DRAFT_69729 [Acaromyces ingoldii]PWN91557.1 hypothetical protein FA10DRAFT_69729 [Acaromyces ingoldii]